MKKVLLFAGSLFIFMAAISSPAFAVTNPGEYPAKPEDAATINDIQGQVGSSYFQDNTLKQGASNVAEGTADTGKLLKTADASQKIKVIGAQPSPDNADTKQNNIPWVGLAIFAVIIIAPLIIIFNMIKNLKNNQIPQEATESVLPIDPNLSDNDSEKVSDEPREEELTAAAEKTDNNTTEVKKSTVKKKSKNKKSKKKKKKR